VPMKKHVVLLIVHFIKPLKKLRADASTVAKQHLQKKNDTN